MSLMLEVLRHNESSRSPPPPVPAETGGNPEPPIFNYFGLPSQLVSDLRFSNTRVVNLQFGFSPSVGILRVHSARVMKCTPKQGLTDDSPYSDKISALMESVKDVLHRQRRLGTSTHLHKCIHVNKYKLKCNVKFVA
jgi:hypothetical protein